MSTPDFYLASTESYDFEDPRECFALRRLRSNHRDDLLLVRINPPIIGQQYGLGGKDIEIVILATRHKGYSLFPIAAWPVYVHIARLLHDIADHVTALDDRDFESLAWGELYPNYESAQRKAI